MSLASFHYAFDSRDELIDELITTVVAREQQAVHARRSSPGHEPRATSSRPASLGYFEHLKADPEHEQAMLELTQYALRSPERHPLAARPVRAVHRARRALARARRRARRRRVARSRSRSVARVLVAFTDGLTLTWLVDRDDAAATGGRTRGRRRPLENGRPPMTSLDPAPPAPGDPDDRPSPRSPNRSAASPPGGSPPSPPSGSASGWRSSRPCSCCCPRRSTPSCTPRTGSTASSRSASSRASRRIATIIAYPLTGALSDRTTSRFGRRRPWIVIGRARLRALARRARPADRDLGDRRGVGRGIRRLLHHDRRAHRDDLRPGAGEPARLRLGLDVGAAGGRHHRRAACSSPSSSPTRRSATRCSRSIARACSRCPFLTRHDQPLAAAERARVTAKGILAGFWISPRKHPDFGWTLLSRVLVSVGNALGTSLLLYFLMFRPRRRRRRGRPHRAHAHLHGVRDPRVAHRSAGSPTGSAAARPSSSSHPACRASPRCCSRSSPTSRSRWSPRASSASATAASSRSTRRSPPRCCPTPPRAARTSAS